MFRAVVLFCAVLALTKGETTEVSRCLLNNSGPLPLNAYIAGCERQPCRLEQGKDAVVEIIFRVPYVIHQMRTVAFAYLSVLGLPYDLGENAHTCNNLSNTYCPVVEGEIVRYQLNMPIEDFMPVGTTVPIEFRIQDDASRYIMCLRAVVTIVAPGSG